MDKTHTPGNLWWVKSRRAQSTDDYETWIEGGVVPTLNVFDNATDTRAVVLIGVWSVREDAKANTFSATPADTALTVNAHQPSVQSHHAQLFIAQEQEMNPSAYDEYNDSIADTHHTLRAGTKQSTGVVTTVVRRLTPIECERLQGFPDNWTAQRIDHKTGNVIDQKDSARYKQMGNAVAVPCVEWIINRLIELDTNV